MSDASSPDADQQSASSPGDAAAGLSGGVDFDAQRDASIGGDVVSRDKIVSYIRNIEIDLRLPVANRVRCDIIRLEKDSWRVARQPTGCSAP
jgi:hypothetical protein